LARINRAYRRKANLGLLGLTTQNGCFVLLRPSSYRDAVQAP
jgi:hypothetical protein